MPRAAEQLRPEVQAALDRIRFVSNRSPKMNAAAFYAPCAIVPGVMGAVTENEAREIVHRWHANPEDFADVRAAWRAHRFRRRCCAVAAVVLLMAAAFAAGRFL